MHHRLPDRQTLLAILNPQNRTRLVTALTATLGFSLGFLATDLVQLFNQPKLTRQAAVQMQRAADPGTFASEQTPATAVLASAARLD